MTRTMTEVARLTYAGGEHETVGVVMLDDDRASLASHAGFIPLAPGDVVRVDAEREIVGLLDLAPVWTYEVEFPLPTDMRTGMQPTREHYALVAIAKLLEQWHAQGIVSTLLTNFTALISSADQDAIHGALANKLVEHSELVRTPAARIDLEVAKRNADLNGDGGGPWA